MKNLINSQLIFDNIQKYISDSIFGLYYNSIKRIWEKALKELKRICDFTAFLNKMNPKLEKIEKILQQVSIKANILFEYFESEILIKAIHKVLNNMLFLKDLVGIMEKDIYTSDEIALILEFVSKVREFAAKV